MDKKINKREVIFSHKAHISIEDISLISHKRARVILSNDSKFRNRINDGAHFLQSSLDKKGYIYGVTTGYGDDCTRGIPLELVYELPDCLARFHGCGMGEFLNEQQTRAILAVRLAALCRGFSGVTFNLLRMLETLLQHDILPLIPCEGSVGASGDLTPLSYIAAVITGKRNVMYKGQIRSAQDVFTECNITPHKLQPKEALAIMNGTSVMTGLATEAFERAQYVMNLATRLTALTSLALKGNPIHYDPALFAAKPHPGQAWVASCINADLQCAPREFPIERLQDRYSTRCAPHIIGVLADYMDSFRKTIEIEINSATDNPLVDLENEPRILSGGHFYGGHIAFVMDSMKNLIANIADLVDRQIATLVDPKMNHGLPANLTGVEGERIVLNHGLKAAHIAASAFTAEALKLTLPASIFSRSTESHNQDKVSMGTIAARDALRVLQLTEQVLAIHLITCTQAVYLREREGTLTHKNYSNDLAKFIISLKERIPFIDEDRELDVLLRSLTNDIQDQNWTLYNDN